MNEEERKAIEKFVEKCNKFDESVEIKGVSVGEEYRILETVCKALDLVEKLQKENEELKKDYYNVINKIENKIDRFDYEFEKSKRQNDKDKSDYYWNLIINFTELLESEE